MPNNPCVNSAVVIARMLNTEGFTDHTAGLVRRYALRHATPGQLRRWKRTKQMFAEMVKAKLDDRDKMVLGKMMGCLCRFNFDTALKIGLTAQMFPDEASEPTLESRMPSSFHKKNLIAFLQKGPARRKAITAGTHIPPGSLSELLSGEEFEQVKHGFWKLKDSVVR